ncbi:MAG: choloylglycine hydrolase family protein [Pseudomonadota bacterium]
MKKSVLTSFKRVMTLGLAAMLASTSINAVQACTGIRLIAEDGGVVYGRSMEWGAFDLNSRVAIIPRGLAFTGTTPDGVNGKSWTARYGVVGLDMLEKDFLADGMNEAGLAGGMFYHPGFASYPEYEASKAEETITAVDLLAFVLTQFSTIEEVKKGLKDVAVVAVVEEAIGIPVQAHWMIVEPTGKSLVIEYENGELRLFDNPLGVVTNAPGFDWHITNLRNYLNLSAVALPDKNLEDMNFSPLGGRSGMIGLPGDFTPPSRFVRAVAWSQTARPTDNAGEATYELLRILDNFNVPLGAAEGSDQAAENLQGMRSSTIWTTAWDQQNRELYFHTQHNRRLRKVSLDAVDFSGEEIIHIPLEMEKTQDVLDLTPVN